MNDYASRVLQGLTARNPNQPEFLQAATEMLCSLTPVLERHPEFEQAGLLERFVEPECTPSAAEQVCEAEELEV